MTWGKAAPVLALCVLFDALRGFFNLFWLFGPAILGVYCTSKVGGYVGALWGLTPAACGVAATGVGYVGAPVFTMLGVIMAFAVGLLGWMTIGLIMLLTNARILKGNGLWFIGSLAISETPFLGAIPAFTGIVWRMYHAQIKKEKAARKKHGQEQNAALAAERAQRLAELQKAQAEQSEMQERYRATSAEADEEIPDELPETP